MSSPLSTSGHRLEWDSIGRQAAQILSTYIRLDTSNPPGNTGEAARFLAEVLKGEGIETASFESTPGRINVVARLRAADTPQPGNHDPAPLLLLHHMDVVPAEPASWSVPPFDGVVRDEQVWGRGAIDDKGLGTIHLMALLLLKRWLVPLKRDVILMAVADEEEGGEFGARWMVEHHWSEIDCGYVWDEGGTGSHGIVGTRPIFAISVAEKRHLSVQITARGAGGHGSMGSENTVEHLVSALYRLAGYNGEIRFDEVTRGFFRRIAQGRPFPASWLMRHAGHPVLKPLVAHQIGKIPSINAMVRDTLTPTVVRAGNKTNVSPDVATATLDARLLPGTEIETFLGDFKHLIDDRSISIEADSAPAGTPPSSIETALFQSMESVIRAHMPRAIVTPFQTPVATDSRFFRERGVDAYGLIPIVLTQSELNTIHGVDERLSVENLTLGIKIAFDVVRQVCA